MDSKKERIHASISRQMLLGAVASGGLAVATLAAVVVLSAPSRFLLSLPVLFGFGAVVLFLTSERIIKECSAYTGYTRLSGEGVRPEDEP